MRRLMVAGLAAGLVTGCADGTGPADRMPAELVGEWQADRACAPPCTFTLTWTENSAASFDALQPPFELALRMSVEADGGFRFWALGAPTPAGRARVVGQALVVTDAQGIVDTIDYQLNGSSVRLDFRRPFRVVSFNPDTVKDPSWARVVMVRR